MNFGRNQLLALWWRHESRIKGAIAITAALGFYLAYCAVGPVHRLVDRAVNPAVGGLTVAYGKVSTLIYRMSGVDLGFVSIPPDPEFVFSVRLATYINERRAAPLFDMAADPRLSLDKRERALKALLRFESAEDWVQPFLNEISKGGLLYLYEKSPLLDELVKRIRADGGIRQPLVRAYAEVVFSFMLQHPDMVMRRQSLRWVSDVIAEDALFLLIPRFDRENEPDARKLIEEALLQIRAVSEPETAKQKLASYYQQPPWPSLRLPIAVLLARMGHASAVTYLNSVAEKRDLTESQRTAVRLALAQTPLPHRLTMSEQERRALDQRRTARAQQLEDAEAKRRQVARAEQIRVATLQRAARTPELEEPAKPAVVAMKPTEPEKTSAASAPAAATAAKPTKPETSKPEASKGESSKTSPAAFPIAGAEKASPPEPPPPAPPVDETEVLVRLPEPTTPAPRSPRQQSVMNSVDMVFEVTGSDAGVYQNPGVTGKADFTLDQGSKGNATFEFMVGEEKWYQIKTKKGEGWVNGSQLRLFDLSPQVEMTPAAKRESLDGDRAEQTFFEASMENASVFAKPADDAKVVGTLKEGISYLAVKSEKVGADRWFQLNLGEGKLAWARGIDLRLSDTPQPSQMNTASAPLSQRGKKSAFQAEWIKAGVKGVGVYERPSIAGKMLTTIDPPKVYKVTEQFAGDGTEWYKIQLSKGEGWVKTMDVSLTTSPSR